MDPKQTYIYYYILDTCACMALFGRQIVPPFNLGVSPDFVFQTADFAVYLFTSKNACALHRKKKKSFMFGLWVCELPRKDTTYVMLSRFVLIKNLFIHLLKYHTCTRHAFVYIKRSLVECPCVAMQKKKSIDRDLTLLSPK